MTSTLPQQGRRRGRPSQAVGRQLTEHIIRVATQLFSERGYEQINIELVISAAQISKQTFYSRFKGKEDLFDAVMKKDLHDLLKPYIESDTVSFESRLISIGVELSRRASLPAAVELNRLVSGARPRFPALSVIYKENCSYAVSLLADLFANFEFGKQLPQSNLLFLAEQFLYVVTNQPIHNANRSRHKKDEFSRVESSVRLFLGGAKAID